MGSQIQDEIEVKIEVSETELESLRVRLKTAGFSKTANRQKEENLLFDFPDRRLTNSGCALRLREYGGKIVMTYKGPRKADPLLKIREEIETLLTDFNAAKSIFEAIGLEVTFSYGKYREKYSIEDQSDPVEICIDETPVGNFVEIEGSRRNIDRFAVLFNWGPDRFIQKNYIDLYQERLGK